MKPFKNRKMAGQQLVSHLRNIDLKDTTLVALPKGGVPLAHEIASSLGLPWDILIVKKICAPHDSEYSIGAVSEDALPIWNRENITLYSLRNSILRELAKKAHDKLIEQSKAWRKDKKALELNGRNIVIVDDGLATGLTMHTAVEFLRRREVNKIYVSVPVGSKLAVDSLKAKVDGVFAIYIPEPLYSIRQWYEEYSPVSDTEVSELLCNQNAIHWQKHNDQVA